MKFVDDDDDDDDASSHGREPLAARYTNLRHAF